MGRVVEIRRDSDIMKTTASGNAGVPREGISLLELLVVMALLALLIGLAVPAVQQARLAARNVECKNRIRQIATGLQNHHSQFGFLPQDGANGWGYAAYLLPQVEQAPLFDKLSPLQNPLAPSASAVAGETDSVISAYVCPLFQSTPTISSGHGRLSFLGNPELLTRRKMRLSDVLDGESLTAAFGETSQERAWPLPGTAAGSPPNSGGDYGSRHVGGANFALCDGSVRWIADSVDAGVIAALFTVAGKEVVGDF